MIFLIAPNYNNSQFLNDFFKSVLSQTYKDFKLIFVDDGSTDNSLDIAKQYVDDRIIILAKKHDGPSSSRNLALDYVFNNFNQSIIGQSYVAFVDSDDEIHKDYLHFMANVINDNNAEICIIQNTKNKAEYSIEKNIRVLFKEEAILKLVSNQLHSHSHCKLYKAPLWQNVRFPVNITLHEDTATIFLLFLKSNKIVLSNSRLYFYRENPNSIVRGKINNRKCLDVQNAYIIRYNETLKQTKDFNNYYEIKKVLDLVTCPIILNSIFRFDLFKCKKGDFINLKRNTNYFKLKFYFKNSKKSIKNFIRLTKLLIYKFFFLFIK